MVDEIVKNLAATVNRPARFTAKVTELGGIGGHYDVRRPS
jgi:hypothetical protein